LVWHLSWSTHFFYGGCVDQSYLFSVVFIDHCLFFCPFSARHCSVLSLYSDITPFESPDHNAFWCDLFSIKPGTNKNLQDWSVSTRRINHPELLTDNYVYLTHKNQRFSLVCHFFIYLVDLLWYENITIIYDMLFFCQKYGPSPSTFYKHMFIASKTDIPILLWEWR
jgi:hypothetical protein